MAFSCFLVNLRVKSLNKREKAIEGVEADPVYGAVKC
jgi:hypothetical protein